MCVNQIRHERKTRRGGTIMFELLVVLPMLLFIILAIVVFSLLESNKHLVIRASAQGSRVAAQGGNEKEVGRAVRDVLGSRGWARHATIETDLGRKSGDAVLVRVSVPARRVVPDALRFFGFSIRNMKLVGQSVHRRESD